MSASAASCNFWRLFYLVRLWRRQISHEKRKGTDREEGEPRKQQRTRAHLRTVVCGWLRVNNTKGHHGQDNSAAIVVVEMACSIRRLRLIKRFVVSSFFAIATAATRRLNFSRSFSFDDVLHVPIFWGMLASLPCFPSFVVVVIISIITIDVIVGSGRREVFWSPRIILHAGAHSFFRRLIDSSSERRGARRRSKLSNACSVFVDSQLIINQNSQMLWAGVLMSHWTTASFRLRVGVIWRHDSTRYLFSSDSLVTVKKTLWLPRRFTWKWFTFA